MSNKINKKEKFIKQPTYEGGEKALRAYVSRSIVLPEEVKDITGVIKVKYDISYKGEVIGVHIKQGLHPLIDQEVHRVLRTIHFTVPKVAQNIKVVFHKQLNIHFGKQNHQRENDPSTDFKPVT